MEENNVYAAPQAEIVDESNFELKLASRWKRLFGSIIDSIIVGLVTLPLMYFTGAFQGIMQGKQPTLLYSLGVGFAGIIFFLLINFKFLKDSGQTLGKKALGTKIVNDQGETVTLGAILLKRYGFYFFIGLVPVIGGILNLVNAVTIFGSKKKCIHDMVGGTQVVDV